MSFSGYLTESVLYLVLWQTQLVFCTDYCGSRDKISTPEPDDWSFVRRNSWPWWVSVQSRGGDHFCGGVMVSDTLVMTAAHCHFYASGFAIEADEVHVSVFDPERNTSEIIHVDQLISHPNFSFHGKECNLRAYDIGFIKLKQQPKSARKICLPTAETETPANCFAVGSQRNTRNKLTVSSVDLRYVVAPVVAASACKNQWGERLNNHTLICAGRTIGHDTENRDGCPIDSDGPLICQVGQKWYTFGIVSCGSNTCMQVSNGNTNVESSLNWIKNITQRLLDSQDDEIRRLKKELQQKKSQIVQLKIQLKTAMKRQCSQQNETIRQLKTQLEVSTQKLYACQLSNRRKNIQHYFDSHNLHREMFPLCNDAKCYLAIKTFNTSQDPESKISYGNAWEECTSIGGIRLAHFRTFDVYNWFVQSIDRNKKGGAVPWNFNYCGLYWIGAKRFSAAPSQWKWVLTADATNGIPIVSRWQNFTEYRGNLQGGNEVTMNLGDWECCKYKFYVGPDGNQCGYVCEFYTA